MKAFSEKCLEMKIEAVFKVLGNILSEAVFRSAGKYYSRPQLMWRFFFCLQIVMPALSGELAAVYCACD
jgi:hypothetical protein